MPDAKERPILFSGEMVRALMDGRKTMTRRVIKPQPPKVYAMSDGNVMPIHFFDPVKDYFVPSAFAQHMKYLDENLRIKCSCGVPGDRLWVRETWHEFHEVDANDDICHGYYYRADDHDYLDGIKWRPSIHMPRRASRITLEITGVRVERVQDITEEDAKAEGVIVPDPCSGVAACDTKCCSICPATPIESFRRLWDSLANRGFGWQENPWVYVISFRRIEKESPCQTN